MGSESVKGNTFSEFEDISANYCLIINNNMIN